MIVDFLIIGGGIAGLTAGSILSEEFNTMIIEKEPIDTIRNDPWVVLAAPMIRNLGEVGIDSDILEPIYMDDIQVHDTNGKVVFEYSYPLIITKLSRIRSAFLKNFDLSVIEKTSVSKDFIEEKGIIKKMRIENRRSDIIAPQFIVDTSGRSLVISRRSLIAQSHRLYRHNIFRYFQSMFSDINRSAIDRDVFHVVIGDLYTPAGMSSLFIIGDKAYIIGFYNNFLSSVAPKYRGRFVKNLLGVGGRLVSVNDWIIPLSHPIVNPTYANAFLMGFANLSIYPFFTSGVNHNISQTQELTWKLSRIIAKEDDIEAISLKYAWEFIHKHIFKGFLNDIMRIFLLGLRSYQLENMVTMFFELLKTSSGSSDFSDILVLARLTMDTLDKLGLTRKVEKIISIIIEFHRIYEKEPEEISEVQEKARKFNSFYVQKIGEILPEEMKRKISFKQLGL